MDDADLSPATAATLDVAGQNLADRTAYLARVVGSPVLSLKPQVNVTQLTGFGGWTAIRCMAFDPFLGIWILGGLAGGGAGPGVNWSHGGDAGDWNVFGASGAPASGSVVAMCKDPTGTNYYGLAINPGNPCVVEYLPAGGAWTLAAIIGSSTSTSAEMLAFGAVVIIAVASSGAGGGLYFYTSPGSPPGTMVNAFASITTTRWLLKGSTGASPLAIAVPTGVGATAYYTSPDGVSWTTRAFPGAVVGAGDTMTGLTWTGSQWVVSVSDAVNTATRICSSLDGINWTVTRELFVVGSAQRQQAFLADLESAGGILVGAGLDQTIFWPQNAIGTSRLFASGDQGLTWYPTGAVLTVGGVIANPPRLISNGTQIAVFNPDSVRISGAMGSVGNAFT